MKNYIKKLIAATTALGVLCIGQIAVARISNPGGAGGSQTPWTSAINAATFDLNSVGKIGIGTSTPLSYVDIRGTGTEDPGYSMGLSLSTTDTDAFFVYNGGGTFEIVSQEQYDAGIGTGIFRIEKAIDGEIAIAEDAGFTGSIYIGNGNAAAATLDSDVTTIQGDTSVTIGGGGTFVANLTETGTVFASSTENTVSAQMLPEDIEHGLIEYTPNTESISLLLPAVSELPATFIPTAGDRRVIQLFNATTTTGITITLDPNGDTDWVGTSGLGTSDAQIMQTLMITRLSDGRVYIQHLITN